MLEGFNCRFTMAMCQTANQRVAEVRVVAAITSFHRAILTISVGLKKDHCLRCKKI